MLKFEKYDKVKMCNKWGEWVFCKYMCVSEILIDRHIGERERGVPSSKPLSRT